MNNLEKDFQEITADGKTEIVPGSEKLKKDPKKKLKDKWNDLKKGLNNLDSIMDLAAASQPEEPPPEEEQEQPQDQDGEEVENENQEIDPEMAQADEMESNDESMNQDENSDGGEMQPQEGEDEAVSEDGIGLLSI